MLFSILTTNIVFKNQLIQLVVESLYMLIILTPLWLLAAYEDHKTHSIPEYLCIMLAIAITINAFLFNSILALVFVLSLLYFVFREKEIDVFGQADFLIVAHFITGYRTILNFGIYFIFAGICWLVCIIIYLIYIRIHDNVVWKPFSGIMIPAIPSYAFCVLIMSIVHYPLVRWCFFKGL